MGEKNSIRQKAWGVFVKPYSELKGDKYINREGVMFTNPTGGGTYIAAQGGEPYMLYKTTTSFAELRKIVKEALDVLEQNRNLIKVCEIIPIDYLVTPLV